MPFPGEPFRPSPPNLKLTTSSHRIQARLSDEPDVHRKVQDSVDFLQYQLADGAVIYGVTTGFGGSADTRTRDYERLQSAAIQHLNVGILLESDKGQAPRDNELLRSHALPPPIVRAAMLIRCNSLVRGHSGVRLDVIQAIMRLLSRDMIPVVPLRGSISASGDLSTLSYIAGALEGNPDIFVKVGATDKIISADQALPLADLNPVRLQAKEGLGITNGTAPSCAAAAIVMHQANQLALLTQLLTAMGTEVLEGTRRNYHPFISAARPHDGQKEAAANIVKFITGSFLSSNENPTSKGLAQDRYALRTAPQWIGPQLEDLLLATRQVATELNSTTDNPLIDAAGGDIHHGGNFQAMTITSAMEKTMLALQNLGRLVFAQNSELINNTTNKGLPPNLCVDEPSTSFTFKGFDVNMAAYMAELAYLARPISSHIQVADMTNQSVNSMALVAARYALEAVEVLSLMAATYILALCQALDLRYRQWRFGNDIERDLYNYADRLIRNRSPHVDAVLLMAAGSASLRWDELSHMDTPGRSAAVAKYFIGEIVDHLASICPQLTVSELATCAKEICDTLVEKFETVRRVTGEDECGGMFGRGSRLVYKFVRNELAIPLNRGVADHAPLMRDAARHPDGSFRDSAAPNDAESWRDAKILGSMAGKIYKAIRDGRLNDRIMELSSKEDFWTDAS